MGAAGWSTKMPAPTLSRSGRVGPWYAAAVVVGSALIIVTAIKQPFSYDELTQMAPYGSDSIREIVSATRQPPLDPLLGAMFQHLLGEGQLRQRLVPVLAGIGTLVTMSLLLRGLRRGRAGAFGVWVLATAPLMVRYSAYTRPYALPLFLMMLFTYAAQQWLDQRRPRWLGMAAVAAVALPLARVPEPTVFLMVTTAALAWFSHRGRLSWSRTRPLIAVSLGALIVVGVPMYLLLQSKAHGFYDPSPSGVTSRFGSGVHEIATYWVPNLASWFPWWPITALAIAATLALPYSRRQLFQSMAWWPLLAAPVTFVLAYHFLNPFPFESLPYRARTASFFVPAYILVIVSLASAVANGRVAARWLKVGLSVLLGGVLLGQLPATANIVLHNAAPDFGDVADVLTNELPDDAIVLYDRPTPAGQSRQPFLGTPRYMGETPYVETIVNLTERAGPIPTHGPVYVLINGQCAAPGRCEPTTSPWEQDVPGWRIAYRIERFTLYEPIDGQDGRSGVLAALRAFGDTLGPELGYIETFSAATLLQQEGRSAQGKKLIGRMYAQATSEVAERISDAAEIDHLDPYE
ncbi:MAG: glycosyltransferase family 39 protein [Propionibacteriales bacterium]|nr:glycosyltransferase family 39 protein [Propionibacteriales bacterium]